MADSLVDLRASMNTPASAPPAPSPAEAGEPAPARQTAGAAAPPMSGAELLAKAREQSQFNDDHARAIRLFAQSKQILADQVAADPEYGQKILPELAKQKGADLAHSMIDAVDWIKIEQMKKEDPKMFSSAEAAKVGFFNSMTFGQLSKIVGAAGQLLQGRPWQEVAEEQGEKFRLMQKAFPNAFLAGETTSFFMPGSLVAKVFQKAAFIGSPVAKGAAAAAEATGLKGAVSGVLEKMIRDPKMLDRARTIVGDGVNYTVQSAAGAAAGTGAIAGIQGAIGEGTQEFSFDRGMEQAADGAVGGLKWGALAPLFGSAVAAAPMVAKKSVDFVAGAVRKNVGRAVEELSTVPVESIRAYNRFPENIRRAAGTENKIGRELVDHVLSDESRIVEVHEAKQLLPQLPNVDPKNTIDFLRSFQKGKGDPKLDPHIDVLHEWANRIEKEMNESGGQLSATQMEAWKKQFQDASADKYGKDSSFYDEAIKSAGRVARLSILDAAEKGGGEAGQLYKGLMEKAAKKADVLSFIQKELGGDRVTMLKRAEKQSDQWFGKNTSFKQERLKELDAAWGTNFYQRMQDAQHAENLGLTKPSWLGSDQNQTPAWTSRSTTGRSTLGTKLGASTGSAVGATTGAFVAGPAGAGVGATVGGAVGGVAGSVASSPKMGGLIVGTSDNITGFMKSVVTDPRGLKLVAGELPQPGKLAGWRPAGAAQGANDIAAKRIAIPYQIQRLAKEISTALVKDGPESAAGVVRLIADTPFFAGVVHYIDLAQKKYEDRNMTRALDLLKQGANQ